MTKQEQIEEMKNIIEKVYKKYGLFNPKWFSEALYNVGYKQEKEVAKEIIAFLKSFEGYANIAAEQLAEQYGIKLDE